MSLAPITEWEVHITAQGCRLRNDLYCVEWDVKLYYTIPFSCTLLCCVNGRMWYRRRANIFAVFCCNFCRLGLSRLYASSYFWIVIFFTHRIYCDLTFTFRAFHTFLFIVLEHIFVYSMLYLGSVFFLYGNGQLITRHRYHYPSALWRYWPLV